MESTNLISVFDLCQLPASEKELTESDYGREKINSFYAHVQIKVTFNEKEEISQPDIDPEDRESE